MGFPLAKCYMADAFPHKKWTKQMFLKAKDGDAALAVSDHWLPILLEFVKPTKIVTFGEEALCALLHLQEPDLQHRAQLLRRDGGPKKPRSGNFVLGSSLNPTSPCGLKIVNLPVSRVFKAKFSSTVESFSATIFIACHSSTVNCDPKVHDPILREALTFLTK